MSRFGRSRPEGGKDALDGLIRVFMFPYSKHLPARLSESFVGIGVPLSVGCDLLEPPFRVGFGDAPVQRTAMPEATVQEHGDTRPEEHEVDPSLRPRNHLGMQSVSTAACKESLRMAISSDVSCRRTLFICSLTPSLGTNFEGWRGSGVIRSTLSRSNVLRLSSVLFGFPDPPGTLVRSAIRKPWRDPGIRLRLSRRGE